MSLNAKPFRLVFHVGGPEFHPVSTQADSIISWLGQDFDCRKYEGKDAFHHLEEADLFILMGLFFSAEEGYAPLTPEEEGLFAKYVHSGKPLLLHHGAIASYDDSKLFTSLIGINWVWTGEGRTEHSPLGQYTVTPAETSHPVIADLKPFQVYDELYYNLFIQPGLSPMVHARAELEGKHLPMVFTAEGGRGNGSGKLAYLANGHDHRAFTSPTLALLWRNSVNWLLH